MGKVKNTLLNNPWQGYFAGNLVYCYIFPLTFVLLLAVGCTQDREVKRFLIGFSQCCDDPWRDIMNAEMSRELLFYPVVDFELRNAHGDNNSQIQQIRDLVNSGIDLLIVAPNESQPLTAVVEEVYKTGIPIILIDRKTESNLYTTYIGADNFEIGKTAADYIVSKVSGDIKVFELKMNVAMSPAKERSNGFRTALAKYPYAEIVVDLEDVNVFDSLDLYLESILREHPEINVVYAHTDLLAEKAHQVARKLGRADDIFFVGVDGIPGTGRGIQAVEDQILDASLLYPTGGAEAIRLAVAALNGLPIEKRNPLQTTVIDHSNARILHFQMKKVASLQQNIDQQSSFIQDLSDTRKYQRMVNQILLGTLILTMILGGFLGLSLRAKQQVNRRLALKNQEVMEEKQKVLEMSREVSQMTKAKVNFFTNISHEFRTPLTLILGFADDLIPAKQVNKEVSKALLIIKQNGIRLLRLVNQLMDFRKVESERMKLHVAEHDIIVFIRGIMQSFSKVAKEKQIDFKLLTRREELKLWFDASMMDKVIFNLLSNAFKFTNNSGRIHIVVAVDEFDNKVTISVEDNGVGLSPQEAEQVFEPFFQSDQVMSGGTGLGLPLSKSLMNLQKGGLELQSQKGKGSRFIISLRLGKDHFREEDFQNEANLLSILHDSEETSNALLLSNEMSIDPSDGLTQQQLLIIEDDEEIRYFLKLKLGRYYQILLAENGEIGLSTALEYTPDLIICDVGLPQADGFAVTQMLKQDIRTSHIPILLLTARSTLEQELEGIKMGADAYMTKPFNIQYLYEKIKNLLHNRKLMKEAYAHDLQDFTTVTHLNSLDQTFLKDFTQYVEDNFHRQDFSVANLTRELSLSRSQLYRKVKALLGQSISDYIQNTRLQKAESYLQDESLSIAEIAYRVGYTSPDYFSTAFKNKYNLTPTQLRKELLQK